MSKVLETGRGNSHHSTQTLDFQQVGTAQIALDRQDW